MIEKLSREEFLNLCKKLPDPLYEAIFAPETGEKIEELCARNRITDKLDFIVNGVGDVMLGLLAPEKFFAALKDELKVSEDSLRQITTEINHFIFYPIAVPLDEIYGKKTSQPVIIPSTAAKPVAATSAISPKPATTTPAPNPRPTKISPGGVAPKAAAARPAVKPIAPITTARPKPTSAPAVPRIIINKKTAPAKPAAPGLIRPQTPPPAQAAPLPQDRPTLSAAPSGLRRKVF